ncbi:hypothetical protein [Nostoc sp.]|uniref:hypothetical protein n=1 Tax=Nostoc sp. TaxID=1180 RepID=UPI002FF78157
MLRGWVSYSPFFTDIIIVIDQEVKLFSQLKSKYKATQYEYSYPDSPLHQILKNLELTECLSNSEYNWLMDNKLFKTAEIFHQQESVE